MKATSYWLNSVRMPSFPPLDRDLTVDVVVIGAGITGATAAYAFKRRGHRVALLERGCCRGVDTSHTTAHLTCVTDLRLHALAKNFGKENARAVWDAGMASLDFITANIRDGGIECGFQWLDGYLHAIPNESRSADRRSLMKDSQLARELGFDAEFVEATPYFEVPGMRIKHQARFHPLEYVSGLLKAIPGNGSHVFEQTEAEQVSEKPLCVTANGHRIQCAYVVIATHYPLKGNAGIVPASVLQTRLYPYTSYVFGARIPKGLIPDALFWDTSEPYYYLRMDPQPRFDYIIFGGKDHKTGQSSDTESVFAALERVLRERIPEATPTHRWSGQVIETNDGLPFMGETGEGQFAITGYAGNGMTLGTIGAMLAVDAFEQHKNPWSDLFSPQRKKLRGGTATYLKENRDYPYYMLRDWLAGSEGKTLRVLKPDEGKILSLKGRKVAAYRDQDGKVSLCSPVCTHLKCIVAWNNAEKTWDCPCHGSRFTPTGEVLTGPAEKNLEPIEDTPTKSFGQHDRKAS